MKKGFAYIPIIIMLAAVLAVGVLGYFAITQNKKVDVNQTTNIQLSTCGNDICDFSEQCPVDKPRLTPEECGPSYCPQDCGVKSNSNANISVNHNTNTESNTNASINTNISVNQNINVSVNQNANTAPVATPKVTLISSTAKDGYINLSWKTDLATNNTVGFREKGGTWLGGPENGDTTMHDVYNHTATIPNIRSGKTIEYYFHSCADLLKWRACHTACGGTESCDRGCTASTLNNCADSQTWSIVMPEYVTPAPTVYGTKVNFYYSGQVNVHWSTDYQSTGKVNYGLTGAYGSSQNEVYASYELVHDANFAVTSGQTYHYSIHTCTVSGKCTDTPDATFTTP